MKTSEVLRKAGDVLRERGWTRAERESDHGQVCLVGAIEVSRNGHCGRTVNDHNPYGDPALDLIPIDETANEWNDAPARTAAEVMHALDAAYVLALQEEGIEPWEVLK